MGSPYRNEIETLRAENERLQRELSARRVTHGKLAVLLVVVEAIALVVLMPWLNARSDAKFWGALAILLGIAAAAAISAFGNRRSPQ